MLFEDVIKESQYDDRSFENLGNALKTQSIQAISQKSLFGKTAQNQSVAYLQVTDEAAEIAESKVNIEAWEQDNNFDKPHLKHLKLSQFSFGTVQNEEIDYEQLNLHRENVKQNRDYQILTYSPQLLLQAQSKPKHLIPEVTETNSVTSRAQGTLGTLAAEIKLPVT